MVAVVVGSADGVTETISDVGAMISTMGVAEDVGEGVAVICGLVIFQAKNASTERTPMVIKARMAPASP